MVTAVVTAVVTSCGWAVARVLARACVWGFQVLPTAICFFDGITKNGQRQLGFIGLEPVPGGSEDEWPTSALEAVLGDIGVLNYTAKVGVGDNA